MSSIALGLFCFSGFIQFLICFYIHAKCFALSFKSRWKSQQNLRKGQAGKIRYGIREQCDQTNRTEYCIFISVLNSVAFGRKLRAFYIYLFFFNLLKIYNENCPPPLDKQTNKNKKSHSLMFAMEECSLVCYMLCLWTPAEKEAPSQDRNRNFHSEYNDPSEMALKLSEQEFLLWLRGLRTQLVSMRMCTWSLALLSGLRIQCCHDLW